MSDKTQHKTVLGADCRITGELALDNDAVIMGQFKGTLRVRGMLELTDSAHVSGTVIAGAVRVAGNVEADVVAEQGIELLAGASLTGQLFTTHLNIVDGAVFQGNVCVGSHAIAAAEELIARADDAEAAMDNASAGLALQADDAADEIDEAGDEADASQQVSTVSNSIDAILKRRRPRALSGGGRLTAGGAASQAKAS
jgi:cytoskeletal protein CcmA (bactofilin family)